MQQTISLIIGILVLIFGIPLGNLLSKWTREELKEGRKWFRKIVFISLAGTVVGLFLRNDALMFTFAFIAIVTSRSLK
ncbi:hypothetical protein COU59_03200 [Candidatus Pacearchaeota archaeon CG10_big_fil_rev_8_21_14_0_10_34_12]|nr:MAG: hypothetical protein COU59_03200 [Candidatus Pacearchaeota archaeon CG10_big_fil_rev_8_21_14_0_10_34_12]